MLTIVEISKNFSETDIFENFDQNWDFFLNYDKNPHLSEIF